MNVFILRVLTCIFFFGFSLYSYIDKQNELTDLKLRIPRIAKEIKSIREENTRLQYEIQQFESPENLMELAKQYPHLKHPVLDEILTLKEGIAIRLEEKDEKISSEIKPKVSLAIGTNP